MEYKEKVSTQYRPKNRLNDFLEDFKAKISDKYYEPRCTFLYTKIGDLTIVEMRSPHHNNP